MVIALAVSAVFTVLTLDRTYRDELMARYALPVVKLHHNLQNAVKYGVNLEGAVGIERDIQYTWNVLQNLGTIDGEFETNPARALVIVDTTGRVLHHAGGKVSIRTDAFRTVLALPNGEGESASGKSIVEMDAWVFVPMRIMDRDGHWTASLIAVLDRKPVANRLNPPRERAIKGAIATGVFAVVFYILLLVFLFELYGAKDNRLLPRMLWTSAGFAVVVMLGASYSSGKAYQAVYDHAADENAAVLLDLVEGDTYKAVGRGVPLEFLDFSHYSWRQLLTNAREFSALEIHDDNNALVVRVTRSGFVHFQNEKLRPLTQKVRVISPSDDLQVHSRTVERRGDRPATVLARVSHQALKDRRLDRVADVLAAIMVSVLVFVELILLFHYLALRQRRTVPVPRADYASARMRPAAFLFLFGIDLSMSFVPLYSERLYQPMLGLPRDLVVGLPISVEFLFVGLAMLMAGVWIDRVGWRRPFVLGVALAGVGGVYSWAAPDLLQFIAARGVLGVGYGLALMASQSYVITRSNERTTAAGLAKLFAGVYGGSICGGVAGAILAEHFGFGPIFLAGGIIVFATLVYALVMLPTGGQVTEAVPTHPDVEARGGSTGARLGRFLSNRTLLGLMLFSSLPASIAAVGFLNYFSPLYLNRIGASQSTIGQILMLYGICLVFAGPWVSRSINTVARKKNAVMAGCLLGGAAFLSFQLLDGVLAAAVAVVLLGLSHALVLSSQSAYALALQVSHEFGKGKALSVFRASGRLGQMLGPVAFGAVAIAGTGSESIVLMGYAYVVMALLLWMVTFKDEGLMAQGKG